jgi:hypothetical protein
MTERACGTFAVICVVGVAGVSLCNALGDEVMTESRSVQLGGANTVVAKIELGVGDIEVGGGASELLEAEFSYSPADWRPDVDYRVVEKDGELSVRQPSLTAEAGEDLHNAWELRFLDGVPISLEIELGAGDATLDLRTLELADLDLDLGAGDLSLVLDGADSLTRADLNLGAGKAEVDLTGEWSGDCYVRLNLGAGSTTLRLPGNVGVRVDADVGIGDVSASGLSRQNDAYVNAAYGESPFTVDVVTAVGVGEIALEVVEQH